MCPNPTEVGHQGGLAIILLPLIALEQQPGQCSQCRGVAEAGARTHLLWGSRTMAVPASLGTTHLQSSSVLCTPARAPSSPQCSSLSVPTALKGEEPVGSGVLLLWDSRGDPATGVPSFPSPNQDCRGEGSPAECVRITAAPLTRNLQGQQLAGRKLSHTVVRRLLGTVPQKHSCPLCHLLSRSCLRVMELGRCRVLGS